MLPASMRTAESDKPVALRSQACPGTRKRNSGKSSYLQQEQLRCLIYLCGAALRLPQLDSFEISVRVYMFSPVLVGANEGRACRGSVRFANPGDREMNFDCLDGNDPSERDLTVFCKVLKQAKASAVTYSVRVVYCFTWQLTSRPVSSCSCVSQGADGGDSSARDPKTHTYM